MKRIDAEQLAQMRAENDELKVINVLAPEQFQKRHIPESENIPVDNENFVEQVERASGGRDQPIVVYCASEECDASEKAAQKLERSGFGQVYDFSGGVQAWQDTGHALRATLG